MLPGRTPWVRASARTLRFLHFDAWKAWHPMTCPTKHSSMLSAIFQCTLSIFRLCPWGQLGTTTQQMANGK